MPIVIKEIQVKTVVEKKELLPDEIPEQLYRRLKEQVVEELSERKAYSFPEDRDRKER